MKELTPIEIKEWQERTHAEFERMKELPVNQPKVEAPKLTAQIIFEASRQSRQDV